MLLVVIVLNLIACNHEPKPTITAANLTDKPEDTVIIKRKNVLNEYYETSYLLRSFTYFWVAGKDTSDFIIIANEYNNDSSLNLNVIHRKPILFVTALERMNECFRLIKEDFNLSKFNTVSFRSPLQYKDLSKQLSKEYEQKFGRKYVNYHTLDRFLLESSISSQLNSFLKPFSKKVDHYSIEKFQLTDKKDYGSYVRGIDLTEYPEFAITGMGLSVRLKPDN